MSKESPHPGLSFGGFVATVAVIQVIIAMAIDMMVPALGHIAQSLHLGGGNERQWVISSFVISLGVGQLGFGVIADRFGRKTPLVLCLGLYALGSFGASVAPGLVPLLLARVVQGLGAAGAEVMILAIIRDCYAGRLMAKVNSLSFMVFLAAPIIAPWLGQQMLRIAPWQAIFIMLGAYASLALLWVLWRLPETMHKQDRRPIALQSYRLAAREVLTTRVSVGYMVATGLVWGGWLGFIYSAQQIFADVFHALALFPAVFALCSVSMAIAALTNARLVERFGMRRLAHGALLVLVLTSGLQMVLAFSPYESLWHFAILQMLVMLSFGFLAGNLSAISMEPLGHIAGTGASIQGFVSTFGASCLGSLIGLGFDGTLRPFTGGAFLCVLASLAVVLVAEYGRLFRAYPPPAGAETL